MFGSQSMRLFRKHWMDANELAQELFAMFKDDIPLSHNAPVTITIPPGSDEVPLTIRNWGKNPTSIKFTGRDDEPIGGISSEGELVDAEGKPKTAKPGTGGGQQINFEVWLGIIIGGSGNTYTCNLYTSGAGSELVGGSSGPLAVTVKQRQIADAATIPLGTIAIIIKRNDTYGMQVPVWLGI